jgi:hypothetical protein
MHSPTPIAVSPRHVTKPGPRTTSVVKPATKPKPITTALATVNALVVFIIFRLRFRAPRSARDRVVLPYY